MILGALGPYPERIKTFVEDGHQVWYISTEELPRSSYPGLMGRCHLWDLADDPGDTVHRLIDLIVTQHIQAVYSLLNVWDGSNCPTATLLLRGCPVPVIRHYKEHYLTPSEEERVCIEKSKGVIFINRESQEYFEGIYRLPTRTACLDADLIPNRFLRGRMQRKHSTLDKQVHLLIAGTATTDGGRYDYREAIRDLAECGAHVHLYGMFRRMRADGRMMNSDDVRDEYRDLAPSNYLHLHDPVPPARFVEEWSQYDAGLLHTTRGDDAFRRLNMPNRYSAYIAAGLPVALPANAMPAMERRLAELNAGIIYQSYDELFQRLADGKAGAGALASRENVTFESVYPELIRFINSCVDENNAATNTMKAPDLTLGTPQPSSNVPGSDSVH
jgi:hypothetical protein